MSRIVIITGASSGLGLSLTKKFIQQGDTVFGISRTKKRWKAVRAEVGISPNLHLYALDLTKEAKVVKFINKIIKNTHKIDLVINSAGHGSGLRHVQDLNLKELQDNLQHNLITSFLVCKHIIPIMRKQKKGLIINVSSMAGKRAVPRVFAYSAAKFGVLALSQCVAKENVDYGIKCITICPGGMNTPMRVKFFGKEDANKQQSAEFVADVTMQVINGKIFVESGGDIVIRHGKITAINPSPAA